MRGIKLVTALIVAAVLACSPVIGTFMPSTTIVEAKTKKPKLNKTEASVLVEKSLTLKVKNPGKGTWKWSSTDKTIATVNSKGKVTGVAPGEVTIKAKKGKTTLKCKVTVKFNAAAAKKNIEILAVEECQDWLAVKMKNNNKYPVRVYCKATFKDENDVVYETNSTYGGYTDWFSPGETDIQLIIHPTVADSFERFIPAKHDVELVVSEADYYVFGDKTMVNDKISHSGTFREDADRGITVFTLVCKNETGEELFTLPGGALLIHDKDGKLVQAAEGSVFVAPVDESYSWIVDLPEGYTGTDYTYEVTFYNAALGTESD